MDKNLFADRLIAWFCLFSGLSISAVAVYYSVAGLMTIFAAAAVPIMIMGTFLESSKLVATVWLKRYWNIAPLAIRSYLIIAVLVLMAITSMGIYGYLSRAHAEQGVSSSGTYKVIESINAQIASHQKNIDISRKTLEQLDASIDQLMTRGVSEQSAKNAIYVRKTQQKERVLLNEEISTEQAKIAALQDRLVPYQGEVQKIESEIGPIRYIAALFYDDVSHEIVERAVRWVIIAIVIVFDPLAIVLLLVSQYTFQLIREREQEYVQHPSEQPVKEAPIESPSYRHFVDDENAREVEFFYNFDFGSCLDVPSDQKESTKETVMSVQEPNVPNEKIPESKPEGVHHRINLSDSITALSDIAVNSEKTLKSGILISDTPIVDVSGMDFNTIDDIISQDTSIPEAVMIESEQRNRNRKRTSESKGLKRR